MWIKSNNPIFEALVKTHKSRILNLSDIKAIKLDGEKKCVWCLKPLTGRKLKWCSNLCVGYASAYCSPQSEHGLHVLLSRQNYLCKNCNFDYMPFIKKACDYANKYHKTIDISKLDEQISFILMRKFKRVVPNNNRPEVDHILAIRHGGQSIGLENHQILCKSCHLNKTKIDNSLKTK
jgi:5-methylcytosine-specific restriction endonuclease McrA